MSEHRPGPSGASDLSWCYDAVHDVSRTFSLTVSALSEPMARDICVGYLLCRVADTVEDARHVPAAAKVDLLDRYRRVLDPSADGTVSEFTEAVEPWIPERDSDDWAVVANAPHVVGAYRAIDAPVRDVIRPSVLELVDGMSLFVDRYAEEGGLRIETVDELEEYCWYAAGTVGELVTGLVTLGDDAVPDRRFDQSRSFSLLLQLVNVAKDAARDFEEENNVYLPLELLRTHGVQPAALADPESADDVVPVIEQVAERASEYLDDAQAWLEAMPETRGNTLAAWAVPYLLAVATLRELRARPRDVVATGNVKVSRSEVSALLSRFVDGDPSVAELRAVMERRPLDEPPAGDD